MMRKLPGVVANINVGSLLYQVLAQSIPVAILVAVMQRRVAFTVPRINITPSSQYEFCNSFVSILRCYCQHCASMCISHVDRNPSVQQPRDIVDTTVSSIAKNVFNLQVRKFI